MQRDVWLVANHPAVMAGWDVKQISSPHLDHAAVVHGRGSATRDHHTHVLHATTLRARRFAHLLRPLPAGLIGGTPDGHAADVDEFELTLLETSSFVGM